MKTTDTPPLKYNAFNEPLFALIPENISSVLDIGCGTGNLGNAILQKNKNINITGITFSQDEAIQASKLYNKVIVHDLNDFSIELSDKWDCIIFSHVLEHTLHPTTILKFYSEKLENNGTIVIGLPNVLFFKQRLQFLKGKFRYSANGGLMDSTHYKFFDFLTAKQLVNDAGLKIETAKGQGAFPLGVLRRFLPKLCSKIDIFFVTRWPGLFSFQFLLVAKKQVP